MDPIDSHQPKDINMLHRIATALLYTSALVSTAAILWVGIALTHALRQGL